MPVNYKSNSQVGTAGDVTQEEGTTQWETEEEEELWEDTDGEGRLLGDAHKE